MNLRVKTAEITQELQYDCQRVEKSETSFKGRKSGQISVCQIFYAGNTGEPLA